MSDLERERREHPADLGDGTPGVPRGWVRHPRERMLITPLMAGIGGLAAFFTVVCVPLPSGPGSGSKVNEAPRIDAEGLSPSENVTSPRSVPRYVP